MPSLPTSPTPLSVKVLQQVLSDNTWSQEILAEKTKLNRSTVSMQLSQQRAIRDEHLTAYLRPLDRHHRRILIAAWMRDVLGADVVGDIIDQAKNRVSDEILDWAPKLTAGDKKMLTWLSSEFISDPDLAEMLRAICRRLGYRPGS
jgi:hypothetical protein